MSALDARAASAQRAHDATECRDRRAAELREVEAKLVRGRPAGRVAFGVSLAALAMFGAGLLLATGAVAPRFVGTAVLVVLAGVVLWAAPLQRRAWLVDRARSVKALLQSDEAKSREADQALQHARKLFEEVDAACQREEAHAAAVLARRPGVERYLRAGGPTIARA